MNEIKKYNPKTPRIGVTGAHHDSSAEAKASFQLAQLGIVPHNEFFPQSFTDVEGTCFRAKSDFKDAYGLGVLFETKFKKLNGRRTKASADAAVEKLQIDAAMGKIDDRKFNYKLLETSWNHSIQKLRTVQRRLAPSTPLVLIYNEAPDENERKRLERNDIFHVCPRTLPALALMLRLAAHGLDVSYMKDGHLLGVAAS